VGNSSEKAIKRANADFLVMTLKIAPTVMCLANHTGTLKFWATAYENRYKMAND
jgi:hypothetical protein